MPSGTQTPIPTAAELAAAAEKKRSLAESRAAAKKYREGLKRKPASTSEGATGGSSSSAKKPRRQEKTAALQSSRERARKYAETLRQPADTGASSRPTAAPGAASGSDTESEASSSSMHLADTTMPLLSQEAQTGTGASPVERASSLLLPPTPPMPDVSRPMHEDIGPPIPPPSMLVPSVPSRSTRMVNGGVAGQPLARPERPSFLDRANRVDTGNVTGAVQTSSSPSSRRPTLIRQVTNEDRPGAGRDATRRGSFLDHAAANRTRITAEALVPLTATPPQNEVKEEPAEDVTASGEAAGAPPKARVSRRRSWRSGLKMWAYASAVVLAPLLLSVLVLGVLIPAWPRMRFAAANAWGVLSAQRVKSAGAEKCFLARGQDPRICKKGNEAADCPGAAVCGAGAILSCDFAFERAKDGQSCTVSAAAQDEVNTVVRALRKVTVEEQCKGSAPAIFRCVSRSSMTLKEAAAAQGSKSLSLLASMPAGNIADLLDLEEQHAGRKRGGAFERERGAEFERVARLSDSIMNSVRLPWRCRARLFAGRLLRDYGKLALVVYAVIMAIVYVDVRRLTRYKRRAKVCSMRDESYKVLLGHHARDPSPIQASHLQAFVGDRRRAREGGGTAAIQKDVRKLWPLVEKEVEHDSRIRRSYKNVRGQHNVACWEWIGPSSATFESVGVLHPGRPPKFLLMWWLHQYLAEP